MNKLLLLVGAAAGYVLGARAGRDRYDQIADQANKLWTDPRVQDKVEEVRTKAPEVAHQWGDQAKAKADELKSRTQGHETTSVDGTYENPTGTLEGDGTATVDTTGFGPGGEKLP
jgi:hypothetical protein